MTSNTPSADDFEVVLVTADRAELAVVRSLLESGGIPTHVPSTLGPRLNPMALVNPAAAAKSRRGFQLMVPAEDAETARELLREIAETPPLDDELER